MAFQTIDDATRIWIKGKEFSVSRMLGDRYGQEAKKYEGGSLCIFRLAPQDYHRWVAICLQHQSHARPGLTFISRQ